MRNAHIVRHWIAVFLWMLFIFWMSTDTFSSQHTSSVIEPIVRFLKPSVTAQEVDVVHEIIRKTAHLTEYFVLGILLFRAFRRDGAGREIRRSVSYSLLVVALYAASDEFHQTFLSSRTASLHDVGIDVIGGFLAQCVIVLRNRRRRTDRSTQ